MVETGSGVLVEGNVGNCVAVADAVGTWMTVMVAVAGFFGGSENISARLVAKALLGSEPVSAGVAGSQSGVGLGEAAWINSLAIPTVFSAETDGGAQGSGEASLWG